jgi:hypothetical protein
LVRGFSSSFVWLLAGGLFASPESCRPCHSEIVEAFEQTGMGRSIQERHAPPSASFYHRLSNRHYTVDSGRMRRHQLDAQGRQIQIVEKSIDIGIGSGNHAVTYAHRTPSGAFIELPLSWYAERSGFAMSPGFDRPDHPDMRREISPACLFCHAAYPDTPVATPRSIDCARCHGDTRAHLLQSQRGNILNPARLEKSRQLDICLQCHLQTVSMGIPDAFRQPGRGVFSFRPGEPLASYKMLFDRADPPGPRFEVNHAGYRLLQSACFQKSSGAITCTTCHDPHSARTRNACASCHQSEHARQPDADCASCHMPKRRPSDAIHVSVTDHWIQRRPVFQNPEREVHVPYSGPVVPFYTPADPLTLAIANISTLTPEVPELYRRHLRRDPNDIPTMAALGNALFRLGQRGEAIQVLERTLRLDPAHPGALNTLAVAYASAGAYDTALTLLQRARVAHPDHSLTWFNLGVTLAAKGDKPGAEKALREAIRLQPDFAEARDRLARLLH